MENKEKEQLQILQDAVSAMSRCDATTLAAALTLLPDYIEGGEAIVLAAAVRIIATLKPTDEQIDAILAQMRSEIKKENRRE